MIYFSPANPSIVYSLTPGPLFPEPAPRPAQSVRCNVRPCVRVFVCVFVPSPSKFVLWLFFDSVAVALAVGAAVALAVGFIGSGPTMRTPIQKKNQLLKGGYVIVGYGPGMLDMLRDYFVTAS